MTSITPADLSAQLRSDEDTFIVDVQPEAEFEDWHVPGSTNIDIYEELHNDPEAAKEVLSTIPTDEVVLTCTAGAASETAADYLRDLGYDVKTLACHRP